MRHTARRLDSIFLLAAIVLGACRTSTPIAESSAAGTAHAAARGLALHGGATAPDATRARIRRAPRAGEDSDSIRALGFDGVWRTTYGSMRLRLDGERVHGTYSYSTGSRIEGRVEGNLLHATYAEPTGATGRALFELADDGSSFRGIWRADAERALAFGDVDVRAWRGTRVVPVPGRVWLVILEAHWEEALADPEFSYGSMLRAFFERLPNVEVRHRYFHDRADFVRFCSEVADLVEPVYLYVSSHGSPEGVFAGAESIDGRTIGECLRDAGELRLVHLGGCDTLGGSMGGEILAAAAPHPAFPITGFKVSVDWAGSAIVDFTYFDLLLERGFAPEQAVRAVRSMVTFAGPLGRKDDPIAGTDLTMHGLAIHDAGP